MQKLVSLIRNNNKKILVLYCNEEEDNNDIKKIIGVLRIKYPNIEFKKVDDSLPDFAQLIALR